MRVQEFGEMNGMTSTAAFSLSGSVPDALLLVCHVMLFSVFRITVYTQLYIMRATLYVIFKKNH